jgi:dGTPase
MILGIRPHSGEKPWRVFSIGNGQKYRPTYRKRVARFEHLKILPVLFKAVQVIEGGPSSECYLGAFMKYPKESLPKKPTKNIADKKICFSSN